MKIYEYTLVPSVVCEDLPIEKVETPENVIQYMRGAFDKFPEQEQFWVIFLNRRNIAKGRQMLTLGTQTAVIASPKDVLRSALLANACAFICVHNHPSGDPSPSTPDVHVTRLLREAARAVNIAFLDHIIIGDPKVDPCEKGFYSFRAAGLI